MLVTLFLGILKLERKYFNVFLKFFFWAILGEVHNSQIFETSIVT